MTLPDTSTSNQCDHIIGLSTCELVHESTGEVFLITKSIVFASHADWKGDGIVQLFWKGDHFKYCPLCAIPLGELQVGMRHTMKDYQPLWSEHDE